MRSSRIRDFPTYILYEDGRIYNEYNNQYIKPYIQKDGYWAVNLWFKGTHKLLKLHVLLATYFIPNPNNYTLVHHKDENKSNYSLSNLEWKDSFKHKRDHGRSIVGEDRNNKLTEVDVRKIKQLLSEGYSNTTIAKDFDVTTQCISRIKLNKTWKHVK